MRHSKSNLVPKTLAYANFPHSLTHFVGRHAELSTLHDLLSRRSQVTILGPPGTGKTRLAIEYAMTQWRAQELQKDIWFCDLTEVRDLDGLCTAVAQVLDLSLSSRGEQAVTQLGTALANRSDGLMILDNFEQVISHVTATIAVWYRQAPLIRLLVTSRERLGFVGEVLFDLMPLSLPKEGETSLEEISRSEAVQLFLERVGEVRPHYSLTDKDAPVVAALIRELDGLPLAIELAAARMRVLSPAHLLKNLDRRFQLLASVGRNSSLQRAGLEASIEDSWEILSPLEQVALAECSVFRGGFSLEAVEHVLDLSDSAEPTFTLNIVQALCDKSLLYYYEPRERSSEPRYSLYLSIREYAASKLKEMGRVEATNARHRRYFLEEGKTWSKKTYQRGGSAVQQRLYLERDNLLAVHRRALRVHPPTPERVEQALTVVLILKRVLYGRGPFGLSLSLLDATLAASKQVEGFPRLRSEALIARGAVRNSVGGLLESLADYEEAQTLAHESGDRLLLGQVYAGKANTLCLLGRFTESHECFTKAFSLFREVGDKQEESVAYTNLGFLEQAEENLPKARECYEQALLIHREIGYQTAEGVLLNNLASIEIEYGQLEAGRRYLNQALTILEEVGDRQNKALVLANLGHIEQVQGRPIPQARSLLEQSLRFFQEMGDSRFEGLIMGSLGVCYHEGGDLVQALACYEKALPLLHTTSNHTYEALNKAYVGVVKAQQDHLEEAQAIFSDIATSMTGLGARSIKAAVTLCGGHVDIAKARAAIEKGDLVSAHAHIAAARELLETIPTARDGKTSLADVSNEVRTAARFLQRAISNTLEQVDSVKPNPVDPEPLGTEEGVLVISESGRWFQPPGGDRVSLIKRRTLRRLLLRLAAHRADEPETALPLDTLFEAGWPGERVTPQLASNRVYTALWMLKKLGLRDFLVSRDDGYLLDPTYPFRLAEDKP